MREDISKMKKEWNEEKQGTTGIGNQEKIKNNIVITGINMDKESTRVIKKQVEELLQKEIGIEKEIQIHKSVEELFNLIPQKYWTSEYGGEAGSIPELMDKWETFIESNASYFIECDKRVCNEEHRIGDVGKNEMFGNNGTFKSINLD
ncbi:unnamed protein product [Brassicogethes aeneus]|uniref:Uncharacterized protein n=1 Tax=Brassicogethes aeneus TaxID=1431903 RepID=A0A9P0AYA3_BRAAE|nr:unnamed protein product [Brassicogethes aeneus]